MLEALEIAQRLGDWDRERGIYINIGVVFQNQGMGDEAIAYYRKSLKTAQEISDRYGVAMSLGNIGTCIGTKGRDSTLYYYKESLKVMDHPEMRDREGAMGWMMNNIGNWFGFDGQIDSAFHY